MPNGVTTLIKRVSDSGTMEVLRGIAMPVTVALVIFIAGFIYNCNGTLATHSEQIEGLKRADTIQREEATTNAENLRRQIKDVSADVKLLIQLHMKEK